MALRVTETRLAVRTIARRRFRLVASTEEYCQSHAGHPFKENRLLFSYFFFIITVREPTHRFARKCYALFFRHHFPFHTTHYDTINPPLKGFDSNYAKIEKIENNKNKNRRNLSESSSRKLLLLKVVR